MIGAGFERAMLHALLVVFAAGVIVALAIVYGIPWLWQLLKPLLHAVTA